MKLKKICFSIFLLLIIIQFVSAGYVAVNPSSAEQGSSINITIYPSAAGMDCLGIIRKKGTTDVLGFFNFKCDSHCRCYFPVTASFNISYNMFGDYYASIWDDSIGDFNKGYFNVILDKCSNWVRDNDESDVDCGGSKCLKCLNEKKCKKNSDCQSNYCGFFNKCSVNKSNKNRDKYSEKEVFLISDENWKEVLKAVSISSWYEQDSLVNYPLLIYHKEDDKFDADSIVHFLNQYKPSHLTIIGNSPTKLDSLLTSNNKLGAGLNSNQISKISIKDYYSYWNEIDKVVVSEENYRTGLMASVFASYINAPLMFSKDIDYGVLEKKKVYVIGEIDIKDLNKIKNISNQTIEFSLEELNKEYIRLTQTDKIILVNSNDLNINIDKNFRTKKSSNVNEIYSKNSLAAPLLATARKELIISIDANESVKGENCKEDKIISDNYNIIKKYLENEISYLFNEKEISYLTIFASPNSIPDSIYRGCYDKLYEFRSSIDNLYAEINNKTANVGRIYGLTISDSSSYVARDLFYERLSEEIYSNAGTGLSIGHSFRRDIENTEKQQIASINSNYLSKCYVSQESDYCINKAKAPLSEYSNKQYIIFGDHGYANEWSSTLKSNKIPELDLSYVFSHACLTNNFWEGKENLMSINSLRQGALIYQGATGLSYSDNSASISLKKLTTSNITLGELNKQVSEEFTGYKNDYSMLGDPLIQLNLKQINWEGIEFYNNSIIDIEYKNNGDINLEMNSWLDKENYNAGDLIMINTNLSNEADLPIKVRLEYGIFSLEENYISEIESQQIIVENNTEKEINFTMEVLETIPSGEYKAVIKIISDDKEIDKKELLFNVKDTLKDIEFNLKSCEDDECTDETRIFNKNEKIYLNYEANDHFETNFSLKYPDGTIRQINLPYEFFSDLEGIYVLTADAKKQGYVDSNEELVFGIRETNIPFIENCNLDNICDNNETKQNCPQDCIIVNFPEDNSKNESNNTIENNDSNNNTGNNQNNTNEDNETTGNNTDGDIDTDNSKNDDGNINNIHYFIGENINNEELNNSYITNYIGEKNYINTLKNNNEIKKDNIFIPELKTYSIYFIIGISGFIFLLLMLIIIVFITRG